MRCSLPLLQLLSAFLVFGLNLATQPDYDVVVVGGGISGMTAAYELRKQKPNIRLVVLEAGDRVGGRAWSAHMRTAGGDNERFDLGGLWIHETQKAIVDILKELSIETDPQRIQGARLVRLHPNTRPSLNFSNELEFTDAQRSGFRTIENELGVFDQNGNIVNRLAATRWNQTSVMRALRELDVPESTVDAVASLVGSAFDTSIEDLSFLYFLLVVKGAGGRLDVMLAESAEGLRIRDGAQTLAERLSQRSDVRLRQHVTRISVDQSPNGNGVVTVTTLQGMHCTGSFVIVALPPVVASEISFVPLLSSAKQTLLRTLRPRGSYYKFIATYPTAFWQEQNLAGNVLALDSTENAAISYLQTFDATSSRGAAAIDGYVLSNGELPIASRQTTILETLSSLLGNRASQPIDYRDTYWTPITPLNRGGVATLGIGEMPTDFAALIRGTTHQRIAWAGTETATEWSGYMSGAVQAGHRAAREVIFGMDRRNDTIIGHQSLEFLGLGGKKNYFANNETLIQNGLLGNHTRTFRQTVIEVSSLVSSAVGFLLRFVNSFGNAGHYGN
uniref:Amine oxidase n=1 Tax=Plectus sambesii TaxID=2011161 RepID=A0A914V2G5_9BILA